MTEPFALCEEDLRIDVYRGNAQIDPPPPAAPVPGRGVRDIDASWALQFGADQIRAETFGAPLELVRLATLLRVVTSHVETDPAEVRRTLSYAAHELDKYRPAAPSSQPAAPEPAQPSNVLIEKLARELYKRYDTDASTYWHKADKKDKGHWLRQARSLSAIVLEGM